MRTCAQLVSYEVSLALSVLGVVVMGQSLNLVDIVNKQQATVWFFLPQFVGLCVFLLGGIAETSRPPFDLPEAETELVAGFHTEYSGMRFALFFLAEYMNMILAACIVAVLFFGGWLPITFGLLPREPLSAFLFGATITGLFWFLLKVFLILYVYLWVRATFPRYRYDQLMRLGWKWLIPLGLVHVVVTAFAVLARG
jgi:NADH-quinone oxidoreductase subunit H